jgi:hypothetical protein
MSNVHLSFGSSGFIGALTLIFITLKLLGKIDWAWIWVLSPLWISAIVGLLVVLILFIIALIIED